MKDIPAKRFSVILYTEPNYDLFSYLDIKEYAYILHDKDCDDNGELKKAHYHLYISLNGRKRFSTLYNDITKILGHGSTQPLLIQKISNDRAYLRYLIHADDLDKYQYSIDEVITNMDLSNLLIVNFTDSQFVHLCMENNISNFKQLVDFAFNCGKIELVMQRAYFFKVLLNIK